MNIEYILQFMVKMRGCNQLYLVFTFPAFFKQNHDKCFLIIFLLCWST